MNDLDRVDIDRYKLIIFLNPYNITDEDRRLIEKRVKQKDKVVMWCYAPGLFNESETSIAGMVELTGMEIIPSENCELVAPRIELTDGKHSLSREMIKAGLSVIGPDTKSCQLFAVRDSSVTALGTLPGTEHVTFAIKHFDDWTSIYAISPMMPPSFYRSLARYSGIHIYNEMDDTLYASKSYLTICADEAGTRTIRFPGRCDVFDPFTNEKIYENVTQFTRDFQENEVLLIRYMVKQQNQ
jgi:hypothetical protein